MNTPETEIRIRRELDKAMRKFVEKLEASWLGEKQDDVLRQSATEEYRQAVHKAARHKIENALAWHTLAVWTEDGKERIGYFARALECRRAESLAHPPRTARDTWCQVHTEAECLFEIGRVHFYEGAPEAARRFLSEALPLAKKAGDLQAAAGVQEDRLEGRIGELLLRVPEDD